MHSTIFLFICQNTEWKIGMEGVEHPKLSPNVTIEPVAPSIIKQEKSETQNESPEIDEAPGNEGKKYQPFK